MNKHTPMTWVENPRGTIDIVVAGRDAALVIAEILFPATHGERVTLARLFVAAPELLEALKKYHTRFADDVGSTQYEEISQLIAKAEGRKS